MAEKPGVEDVVGIDYSEKSIETANRMYAHRNVRRSVEDIGKMPARESYDLVVSFQVIEHLKDAAEFLRHCRRQTRPGGCVAVVTPNRLRLSNRLRILAGGKPKLGDPQHYREYVTPELVLLGTEQGLKYVAGFGYGISLRLPMTHLRPLPMAASLRFGHMFSIFADCFCVVFRNE